jgi:putative ABC transport system permease protein
MDALRQDLRQAFRYYLRKPSFSATAVLILALGIAANTIMFSVVEGVLLRPLPYGDPSALVGLWDVPVDAPLNRSTVTFPNWRDWQEQNTVFEDIALYRNSDLTWRTEGEFPSKLRGVICSSGFFDLLQEVPDAGRFFTAAEDDPSAERTVVLSYAFWQRHFGGDDGIIGRMVNLDGTDYRIIGTTESTFDHTPLAIDAPPDLFLPIGMDTNWHPQRRAHLYFAVARLKADRSLEAAQTEMNTIAARLAEAYPDQNTDQGVAVVPFVDQVLGDVRTPMLLLLGAVALVLLTACANVANLVLERGMTRHREVAVRGALGADRTRLVRQLLTESILLAVAAGILGTILTLWGIDAVVALIPDDVPRTAGIGLNPTVLTFTLLLSLFTGVLFGLLPALRISGSNPAEVMKEGGRATPTRDRYRAGRSLLVAEVAFTMVLLIGAGLMLRSFTRLLAVDPGYDPANVLTFGIDLPEEMPAPERESIQIQLLGRIQAMSEVEGAAMTSTLPITRNIGTHFEIIGRPAEPGRQPITYYASVSPDFFRVLGIPIEAGRAFDGSEQREGTGRAVISRALADRYWPDEDPISQRIQIGISVGEGSPEEFAVIGIAGDIRMNGRATRPSPLVYLSSSQHTWWGVVYVVKTRTDPPALIDSIRRETAALLPGCPIYDIGTLNQHLAGTESERRFMLLILTVFSILTLIMAVAGIYSVISYSVNGKFHEIGLRMTLGADRRTILRLVLGQGLRATGLGLVIGWAGAAGLSRLLSGLLFEVGSTDPLTYLAVALVIMSSAIAACALPAYRATRVDPVDALRYE